MNHFGGCAGSFLVALRKSRSGSFSMQLVFDRSSFCLQFLRKSLTSVDWTSSGIGYHVPRNHFTDSLHRWICLSVLSQWTGSALSLILNSGMSPYTMRYVPERGHVLLLSLLGITWKRCRALASATQFLPVYCLSRFDWSSQMSFLISPDRASNVFFRALQSKPVSSFNWGHRVDQTRGSSVWPSTKHGAPYSPWPSWTFLVIRSDFMHSYRLSVGGLRHHRLP